MGVHRNSSREVHYEVHCRDGASWIILDLFQDRERALANSEKAWKQRKYKAIRVIKESFNPKTHEFDSMELAYHGRKFGKGEREQTSATICQAPADFYAAEGRRSISHLLSETLSSWQVTPTELLHCPKHYYRLQGTGTVVQAAVQRAAVAQSRDADTSIQDRVKQIYALIDRVAGRIKGEWDRGNVPEIIDDDLARIIGKLQDGDESRGKLIASVLSRDLLHADGALAKISRLLLLVHHDHPDWVVGAADSIIGELVAMPDIASNLAGETTSLAETLTELARLARGADSSLRAENKDPGDDVPTALCDADILRALLNDGRMPRTRRALLSIIANKLASSERLVAGPLDLELEALTSVRLSLDGAEGELVGRGTLIDAIEDRCRRFLNPQFVAEFLEDVAGPRDSLKKLIALENHCVGLQNKRRIANHILPMLQSGNSEVYFTNSRGNPLDRMRYLAKLQGAIIASGMTEQHKEHMVERLDQLCHMTMSNARILELLEKNAGEPAEAAKRLLAMIAGECFSEGTAKSAAVGKLKVYLADPKVTSLLAEPPDDPERTAIRDTILSLAGRAGIDLPT